ncbi:MAG: hypothetical protein IM671_13235 [Phenylobacterium sp.]|uniref:hypothetical protein n=1 Tax=Phenylobacterium sp. TaxID=1871053 RepID=UPI0025F95E53|nr:hypothetical protein [Phenylobacterium sp.]MCA6247670.1 hypothetical protein [Phenylobacterium sp.]MCA6255351.1 hypothetical protein [Phenylobacterium sp.]
MTSAPPLVHAHRILAAGLAVFILVHLATQLTAVMGPQAHRQALTATQGLYRNPVVEPVLIAALLVQIVIGARLLARRWGQSEKGFWGWAQLLSGGYLIAFILLHSSAALWTRHIFGMDTDFYWAAAPVNLAPFKYGFFPYYALGVMSVFTHLAAAVQFGWGARAGFLPAALIAVGVVVAGLILASFGGFLYPIDLPPANAAYFEKFGF